MVHIFRSSVILRNKERTAQFCVQENTGIFPKAGTVLSSIVNSRNYSGLWQTDPTCPFGAV